MPKTPPEQAATLDLRGLRCPLPVLSAAKSLRRAAPGALVEILADDPGALADFQDLCRANAHELVEAECCGNDVFRFLVRRGPG